MPADAELRRLFEDERAGEKLAARLDRMLAQRGDRVPEISEQSSACIWDQAPKSCWGLGCQEAPLAPSVLGAWRRDQPLRGIRPVSHMACSAGRMGRVKLQAAGHRRPDDGRAQRTRTAHKSCQEIYMPGVCRTKHAAHLKQINYMHNRRWKWTAGRAHKEGEMLARFCCEGGGMPTRYLYYSLAGSWAIPGSLFGRLSTQRPSETCLAHGSCDWAPVCSNTLEASRCVRR